MKKTALVVATALLVTVGSSMAFASIAERNADEYFKQQRQEFRTEQMAKYLTDSQITQLDELETNYLDSVSDLVKETAKMRIELDQLVNNTNNPDPAVVSALEAELWEKTGQLTEAKKAFEGQAKNINPAFPYAVKIF